jgi:hypothetical protein
MQAEVLKFLRYFSRSLITLIVEADDEPAP